MFQYIVSAAKLTLPFLIPCTLNIGTHFICEYIGCDTWYSLLGYNLACNSCIDAKKLLKDHQVNMYWSIGSVLVSKMDFFMGKEIIDKIS